MSNNVFHFSITDTAEVIENAIKVASRIILDGGVILFPTDTTYALGVNALDESAIEKVYELKLRPPQKPIHVIVPTLDMAGDYVSLNEAAYKLANKFLPGALTLVLRHKNNIPRNLVAGYPTLGIRIPNNPISLVLSKAAGVPITATSANISGQVEVYTVKDFTSQMNTFNPKGIIDFIIDQGNLPQVKPSTIVDLSGDTMKVVREGPISTLEIQECLFGNI